jgi:hypothetical protein
MQSYESLLNGDLNWALIEGSMHFEGNSAVHRTLRRLAGRLEANPVTCGGVDYAIAVGMVLFSVGCRRVYGFSQQLAQGMNLCSQQILESCVDKSRYAPCPVLRGSCLELSNPLPPLREICYDAD